MMTLKKNQYIPPRRRNVHVQVCLFQNHPFDSDVEPEMPEVIDVSITDEASNTEDVGEMDEDDIAEQKFSNGAGPVAFGAEDGPVYGPHLKLSRGEKQYELVKELQMVKGKTFICCLDLFLEVFSRCCHSPGCLNIPQIKHHFVGATLVVNSFCQAGHCIKFCSSYEVNGIYANNLQSSVAVLLSGNNFGKIARMAHFMNLAFPSKATYFRMQRLYLFPAVEEWWPWMRDELVNEFSGREIVVGGDGQCDSSGFSAKNLCYFLMEVTTGYILELEVRDKRHVNLSSTNMEREALKNALQRLKEVLEVVEIVTDASASVKKLLVNHFKGVFHSLDVWHKSKSIKKCLAKVGQAKSMKKIKDWSRHIVGHFWYCTSVCKAAETTSDEEALQVLKDKWIGLLHHVCNSHEWLGGKCDHENAQHDESLPCFDRRDKDFAELQKIILNSELLDSFKYYVRFRYRAYKARKQLAAIDWNFHINLSAAESKSGDQIVSRQYNQRTQQWDLKIVKAEKGYEYIPLLMATILKSRMDDVDVVGRNVSLNKSDPCHLAPTIAAKPPPPKKDLIKRRSRFDVSTKSPCEIEKNPTSYK